MRSSIRAGLVAALLLATWGRAGADAPAFKRTELARHDLAVPDHEAVVAKGEFPPGLGPPRHTHPGDEIGFVEAGELTVEIDGKPAQKIKAGETFFIPAGTVHTARNTGKVVAVAISTYVVEKGKPLATPAPAPAPATTPAK